VVTPMACGAVSGVRGAWPPNIPENQQRKQNQTATEQAGRSFEGHAKALRICRSPVNLAQIYELYKIMAILFKRSVIKEYDVGVGADT
jgi:hypothetical protein